MIKRILITEKQFKSILGEINEGGVIRNLNGTANVYFDSKTDDASNKDFDTRIFGSRNDILYGDNTLPRGKNFADKTMFSTYKYNMIVSALNYINSEDFSLPFDFSRIPNCSDAFRKSIITQIDKCQAEGIDVKRGLETYLSKEEGRLGMLLGMNQNKYERVYNSQDTDINFRYLLGKVPGTQIDVISLFTMNDFNFSDALKNGNIRQSEKINSMIGKKNIDYEYSLQKGAKPYKKMPITYDSNITPDIMNNFSLDDNTLNGDNSHFKKQYGYGGENGYTSITKFMDKSVLYAGNILRKIGFHPDFILSAPSSSKFNQYYCTNLSRKLNIPYINDFFKRNIINVRFDEETERKMVSMGADDGTILKIKHLLINALYGEISDEVKNTVMNFVTENGISFKEALRNYRGFTNVDKNFGVTILCNDICTEIINNNLTIDSTLVYKRMVERIIKNTSNNYSGKPVVQKHQREMSRIIRNVIGEERMKFLMFKIDLIFDKYDKSIKNGFTYIPKRFKITAIPQRFRNCIKNVYIVSDQYLNKQDNSLQNKFKNANFLIFDEDINSGATLKMVCDALQDLMDNHDSKIKCLVNAYSNSGF